jgi:hypothetical protein
VALVHGFYPASSTERAHADVTVGSLAGERSYSKGADVGGMQVYFQRFLPGVFRVPEDFARSGELRGDGQGRGRGRDGGVGWRLRGEGGVVATHRMVVVIYKVGGGKMGVEQGQAADWCTQGFDGRCSGPNRGVTDWRLLRCRKVSVCKALTLNGDMKVGYLLSTSIDRLRSTCIL